MHRLSALALFEAHHSKLSQLPLVQRSMDTLQEMKRMGVQPNLKTYTTLINGWSKASYPEKALACFDEMKSVGLVPDKAVYHCLMTSLLSRAAIARGTIYEGVVRISDEMVAGGICVDLPTAKHWQRFLLRAERRAGDLTRVVQRVFPPDWDFSQRGNTEGDGDYDSYGSSWESSGSEGDENSETEVEE